MGSNSAIEWTDHTFNPWRGCEQVADHPACDHCYAMSMSRRNPAMLGKWGDASSGGTRVVASESMWKQPLRWNQFAAAAYEAWVINGSDPRNKPTRPSVFVDSIGDIFEDWEGPIMLPTKEPTYAGKDYRASSGKSDRLTMHDIRRRLFALIDATTDLDWLLLTKRPENVRKFWPDYTYNACLTGDCSHDRADQCSPIYERDNVWIGTSISDQATADKYVPELLKCRDLVPVLFLSVEPLLGPIDLTSCHVECCDELDSLRGGWHQGNRKIYELFDANGHTSKIDWVIAGGESGPHARPMHPDWVRSLRDQCTAAGVPFFFKQWGEYIPRSQADLTLNGHEWGTLGSDNRYFSKTTPWNGHDDDGVGGEAVVVKVGKKAAGRLLDGREWNEFPTVNEVVR